MSAGGSTAGRRRAERPTRGNPEKSLGAPTVSRFSLQSRAVRMVLATAALALVVAWLGWYATTPEELPRTDRTVSASGVVGTPLYVGMFAASDDFNRTIRISGVKVHATTNTDMTITPLLCRRGTVGVTTDPEQFCSDLVNPEGARFVSGDSIILRIESEDPALAVVDQIRVAYREDIRWDTQPAGAQQAIVTVTGRPDVPEDDGATQ
ncbi:MAG TPA: hypothetical protein VNT31_04330 [Nocardioides sp.]|nr:hypothetical protein [Nocardioides sp.]